MNIRDLKNEANDILRQAQQPPRKIFLIHTAIAVGASVLLALVSYILDQSISSGGGLSGMSTQAALSTAQVVLQLVSTVAMPFWSAGLIFAAMGYIRRDFVSAMDLPEGFRRFKPILTSGLMMGLQYLARGFISVYLSSMLVMATPFAAPAYRLATMLEQNPELDLTAVNVEGMLGFYAATVIIFALVFGVLALPVYYRYRMVNYIIMDEGKAGGLRAMLQSRMMMQRRRWKLFRLDLSFWWFYGLELLLSAISLGSLLTELMGVSLPISQDAAYWIFQLAAVAGHLVLYTLAGPKIEVTYALCYREFLQPPEPPMPQPPKEHPWTY